MCQSVPIGYGALSGLSTGEFSLEDLISVKLGVMPLECVLKRDRPCVNLLFIEMITNKYFPNVFPASLPKVSAKQAKIMEYGVISGLLGLGLLHYDPRTYF